MDHKCSFCDYSSDKAYNLKRHTTRQHKEQPSDTATDALPPSEVPIVPVVPVVPDVPPTDTSVENAPTVAPKAKGGRKPAQKKSDTKQPTAPAPAPTPPSNSATPPKTDKNEEEDDDDDGPYDYRDAKTGERLMVLTIDDFNDLYHSIVSSVVDALYAKGMLTRHPFQKSDPKNEEQKM